MHHSPRLVSSFRLVSSCVLLRSSSPAAARCSQHAGAEGDTQTHPIRLNGLGYLPGSPKIATVIAPGGAMFNVRSAADDSVAWNAAMGTAMTDELTDDMLFQADFSEFTTAGSYYIEVPGLGRSASFTVGPNVYNDLLTAIDDWHVRPALRHRRAHHARRRHLEPPRVPPARRLAQVPDRPGPDQGQRRWLARRRRLRQVHHQRRVLGRHDAGGVGAVPAGGLDAIAADPASTAARCRISSPR